MKLRQVSRILATALVTLFVAAMVGSVFVLPSIANRSWGDTWMRRFVPAKCDALGRQLVTDAVSGRSDAILAYVDPRFGAADAGREIRNAVALANPLSGGAIDLIRFEANNGACGLLYVVHRGDRRAVIYEALVPSGERTYVEAFKVTQITPQLLAQNALTLAGRGVRHWAFALLAIGDFAFVVAVLYMCALAPYVRFRWLWLLAIFVGVFRLTMNWTTGQAGVEPLSLNLPPSGAAEPLVFGPWFVYLDVPLGAFVFLGFRKKLTREREERREWMPTSSSSEPVPPA